MDTRQYENKAISGYLRDAEPPVNPRKAKRNLALANKCKTVAATVAFAKTLTEEEKADVMRLQAQMLRG